MAWKNIPALLQKTSATPQWDSVSSSPYFTYTAEDGSKHEVWHENPRSIEEKTRLVENMDLGGISTWALGLDDTSFWMAIDAGLI